MSRIATAWRQWTPRNSLVIAFGVLVIVFALGLGAGSVVTGRGSPGSAVTPATMQPTPTVAWRVLLRASGVGDVNGAIGDVTTTSFTVTHGVWRVVVPETCGANSPSGQQTQSLVIEMFASSGAQIGFLSVVGTCGGAGQDGLAVATETALGTFRLRVEAAQAWSLSVQQQMEAA